MKIVFLGTPDFALPPLRALHEAKYDVIAVFTQPDRQKGRGNALSAPPVKELARVFNIPVYQPERIRSEEGAALLKSLAPDLMITAAFGQILSEENLNTPRLGCINIHGSLLPKYRGAAPIQWAVINGEKTTGVTTMMTDIGVDTGDMLLSREIEIGPDETAGELYTRLSALGADILIETLQALKAGTLKRIKQDESKATRCPMLKKEHGQIDFMQPAQRVHDLVRGVNPWPGAYGFLNDKPFKVWKTRITGPSSGPKSQIPGTIVISSPKEGLFVQAGDGLIELVEIQAPGKARMEAKAFLRGKALPVGTSLCQS